MKTARERLYESRALAVVIPALIILFPLAYSIGAWAVSLAAPASEPFLERPDAQFEECVRDLEYMRFSHMTLLMNARDETVRAGSRGDVGLINARYRLEVERTCLKRWRYPACLRTCGRRRPGSPSGSGSGRSGAWAGRAR